MMPNLKECETCPPKIREEKREGKIKKAIGYARSQGHGVKHCDMHHPCCVACVMVDILEDG